MTTPVTQDWTVTAAADRVTIDDRRTATVSFNVTNITGGPHSATLAVSSDDASKEWFTIVEPVRLLDPGTPTVYAVKIAIPAEVPAGEYPFRALAYASESAPEENPTYSGPVVLEVPAGRIAQRFRWWWLAVPAALLLIAATVVTVVVATRPAAPEAGPTPAPTVTPSPGPPETIAVPDLSGLTEQQAVTALQQAGLASTVKHRHDPAHAGDLVQSIPPGIQVALGTSIELVVTIALTQPRVIGLKWTLLGSGQDNLVPPLPGYFVGRLDLSWTQAEPGVSSWRVVFSPCFSYLTQFGPFNLIHVEAMTVTTAQLSTLRFYPDRTTSNVSVKSCTGENLFIYAVDDFGVAGPYLFRYHNM